MQHPTDLLDAAAPRVREHARLAQSLLLAAARRRPDADGWLTCARSALQAGAASFAVTVLDEALGRHPDEVRLLGMLAEAHVRRADYEAAAQTARRRLRLQPDHIGSRFLLGDLATALRHPEDPDAHYEQAYELEQRRGRPHRRSFYARLLQRRYREAWSLLHPLTQIPAGWLTRRTPSWTGDPTPRAVCVYGFGGLGDVVLWTRYAKLVASRAGRVVFAAPASLERLLGSVGAVDAVVSDPADAEGALFVHALQLPAVFDHGIADVAARRPYVSPPSAGPPAPPASGTRIGLAWAGAPSLPTDADRSVPDPELLRPLLAVPGTSWVSLQQGPRAAWAERLGCTPAPPLRDLADTAHLIAGLDLVVSVDTCVANLALALGVPTWVFPPVFPEFRWGREGPSPWYPAARLFRRRVPDDWPAAVAAATAALCAASAGTGAS